MGRVRDGRGIGWLKLVRTRADYRRVAKWLGGGGEEWGRELGGVGEEGGGRERWRRWGCCGVLVEGMSGSRVGLVWALVFVS